MKEVFILWAYNTENNHHFMEVFSSYEKLETYKAANPCVVEKETTVHEVDPE